MKKFFSLFFFTAALSICKPNFLMAQVNVNDSLALVALYDSTNGKYWRNKHNWLTQKPVSTWYGVTEANNRIVQLNLSYNRLEDFLPSQLNNLSNLTHLDLAGIL